MIRPQLSSRTAQLISMGCPSRLVDKVKRPDVGAITFKNQDTSQAEILIYEAVGFDWYSDSGITAKWFNDQLKQIKGDVTVRLNSPGGDVFDGLAIFNMLEQHPGRVTMKIEGLAASIASVIAMAGDTIQMAESGTMMIHDAWSLVVGNEQDMRDMASVLEKIDGQIAAIYSHRSGKSASKFRDMMDKDTYLDSGEAIKLGLVDSIISKPTKAAASANKPGRGSRSALAAKLAIARQRAGL